MSKHNYSQYSSKPKQNHQHKHTDKVETEVVKPKITATPNSTTNEPAVKLVQKTSQVVRPSLVQETVETVKLPNTVTGKVVNCAKLNVRENATVDSGIVCVLDVMSEIEIDTKKSTENWFYIYTAIGAEGYCMKQYVEAYM